MGLGLGMVIELEEGRRGTLAGWVQVRVRMVVRVEPEEVAVVAMMGCARLWTRPHWRMGPCLQEHSLSAYPRASCLPWSLSGSA